MLKRFGLPLLAPVFEKEFCHYWTFVLFDHADTWVPGVLDLLQFVPSSTEKMDEELRVA